MTNSCYIRSGFSIKKNSSKKNRLRAHPEEVLARKRLQNHVQNSLITIAYIAASALFILSLGGLSQQETARRGNLYGIIGMLIALVATACARQNGNYIVLAGAIVPGLVIGALVASRVQMTAMPQLVAMLHSFVGFAEVLVGFATYRGEH